MTTRTETAILAGGCFWGMQDLLRHYAGVASQQILHAPEAATGQDGSFSSRRHSTVPPISEFGIRSQSTSCAFAFLAKSVHSVCGHRSSIEYHGAFDATHTCFCFSFRNSVSSVPIATDIQSENSPLESDQNSEEPQSPQNCRATPPDELKVLSVSTPAMIVIADLGALAYVANAAPWPLRHWLQWQWVTAFSSAAT